MPGCRARAGRVRSCQCTQAGSDSSAAPICQLQANAATPWKPHARLWSFVLAACGMLPQHQGSMPGLVGARMSVASADLPAEPVSAY